MDRNAGGAGFQPYAIAATPPWALPKAVMGRAVGATVADAIISPWGATEFGAESPRMTCDAKDFDGGDPMVGIADRMWRRVGKVFTLRRFARVLVMTARDGGAPGFRDYENRAEMGWPPSVMGMGRLASMSS
ncbi:hypothetical protein FEM03_16320 [Phragmitibacter flavus]|uniref:Uncharacterized protein n=1 Tax=Phragmitibacter flavus TaxID=2576071 RepID=A0A5R8KC64_9BACT|nr:hypothetical protein [Phragmitibacter flavus]TLD69525.1 hypothetical protein FEM03_16320 [Phragmitibacter flavus]